MEPGFDDVVSALRAAGCVFAEEEARILVESASNPAELAHLLGRRVAGEPLEHVVGWVWFCGRRIAVEPGVFVPRRRTEFLVECAAALHPSTLLDLCCGSGAIGLSVPGVTELHAADVDAAAVECAERNLEAVGGTVHRGDLFDALPPELHGRFDAIVVNAPYVPTGEIELMPREARLHEPHIALDGGEDGARLHRRVAAHAHEWLAPHGSLLIETSALLANSTFEAIHEAGFTAGISESEMFDAVVVIGSTSE
ncbi:methylase [Rhodococcus sp. WWJCD1]|uniref:putative protein N(5)-glutamine methyltransferase n=1 Tax=unclassified Rhodococcus (in: high G+C Gram-positive bacteria) TaxID=192944 RepID=UPI000B9AB95D|nr:MULTISPECIES: putative protein N(5)-glutamine methyltransferase [unclassified Rhodococcus (in: high G+C Gram-positive bacteria)]OZC50178.1 methylase [Rhodococcus sp. WWJCD1]OZE83265.1 methylase [Rhodococcus sp. 15-649-2-2]